MTGAGGQLGHDARRLFSSPGYEVAATSHQDLDITDQRAVFDFIEQIKPNVIINAAAYTAVDDCETRQGKAFHVNAYGAENVAKAAWQVGAALVHISTDYVFAGCKTGPYQEEDSVAPVNVYGASKLLGERLVWEACPASFILRTAWLYGEHGNNFAKTMIRLAQRGEPISVVHDQQGTPTWTCDLVKQIQVLISTDLYGLYHATAQGHCSWYQFALKIFELMGLDVEVKPVTTDQFPRPARRPKNSVLENRRLKMHGLDVMPSWDQGLFNFLKTVKEEQHEAIAGSLAQ